MIVASSTSLRILILATPMGDPVMLCVSEKGVVVDVIVDRCAGLDVHKDTVMAAVFNWLDHGDIVRDEAFIARTAAGLRNLVQGLAAPL